MNYTRGTSVVGVDDLVLAQAASNVPDDTLQVIGERTGGLVLTDRAGIRKLGQLRANGFASPVVLDLIGVDWRDDGEGDLVRMRDWRAAVEIDSADLLITPSRRIPPGDRGVLARQLAQADEMLAHRATSHSGAAWVGLGLDGGWLSEPDHLPVLEERLLQLESPVALAFADPFDPVSSRGRVRALRRLAQAVDMAMVRSDLAGIGAWAYGARFAAVGLSSTVRHLPVPLPNAGGSRSRPIHVLVPTMLGWTNADDLWYAGDHPCLRCACDTCGHRSLSRLGDGAPGRAEEALLHNFRTWHSMANELGGAPPEERPVAWHRVCKEALDAGDELAGDSEISLDLSWQPAQAWTWL